MICQTIISHSSSFFLSIGRWFVHFCHRRPPVFVLLSLPFEIHSQHMTMTTTNRQLNKQSNKNRENETTNDIQIVRYVLRQRKHTFKFERIPFRSFEIGKKVSSGSSTSYICIWFVGIFLCLSSYSTCSSHMFIAGKHTHTHSHKNCNALVLTDYIENVICFRNTKWFSWSLSIGTFGVCSR